MRKGGKGRKGRTPSSSIYPDRQKPSPDKREVVVVARQEQRHYCTDTRTFGIVKGLFRNRGETG